MCDAASSQDRTPSPQTTKVHKTKVQHWYKPPKDMLQHVFPHVLSKDDLVGIKSVDYTVGRPWKRALSNDFVANFEI
jgi:hypothetical protein